MSHKQYFLQIAKLKRQTSEDKKHIYYFGKTF